MQRFRTVAEWVNRQIEAGVFIPGAKLPSLRRLASDTGVSVVTAYRAYELLEAQGVCHARDRSGFYVNQAEAAQPHRLAGDLPVMPPDHVRALDDGLVHARFHARTTQAMQPAPGLLATGELVKQWRRALLNTQALEQQPGEHPALIDAIVQRAGQRGLFLQPEHVLVTRSAMEGFQLCLDSLIKSGAPVLVESPSYYPVLECLRHRGIKALEIYAHPQQGLDPEQFEHILATTGVKLCVLMGNHRLPTGVSYNSRTLERVVRAASLHRAVIIENDLTAELGYKELRRPSFKTLDKDDSVVQFGGTQAFLPGDFDVGWVLAGKHAGALNATRHRAGIHWPPSALQVALGAHLKGRQMERELRQMRQVLAQRMVRGMALLDTFSDRTLAMSTPTGGYLCWVRGPRAFDAMKLAASAEADVFDFVPGPFFSPLGSFGNFVALNFSAPWTAASQRKLQNLVTQMLA